MVRRRVAAGVGVVALIVIVLVVNGCLKSEKQQALRNYNHEVSQLAQESDEQVSNPLFTTLTDATSKSALNVSDQIDQLRIQAQNLANRASGLSTPGEMSSAQHYLVQVFDFRVEGLTKLASLVPVALGGKDKQAITNIAGDMEIFLTSDVIYSQRVAPLIQQTLVRQRDSRPHHRPDPLPPQHRLARTDDGDLAHDGPAGGVGAERGGHARQPRKRAERRERRWQCARSGTGAEPHQRRGNPTFTVMVEDSGEIPETNVKVNLTVTAAGKQLKASHVIEKTEPGKTVSVAIPVTGVPSGAGKIEANIAGVPGENDLENNKASYLAIFE